MRDGNGLNNAILPPPSNNNGDSTSKNKKDNDGSNGKSLNFENGNVSTDISPDKV